MIMFSNEMNNQIPEGFLEMAKNALGSVVEKAKEIVKKVPPMLMPLFEQVANALKRAVKFNTFGLEVDELNMEKFVEFIRHHIVKESNQSVAIKSVTEEGIFVYVTFAKDRELIPEEQNKTLIIKAKTLSNEVAELFGENELIILN